MASIGITKEAYFSDHTHLGLVDALASPVEDKDTIRAIRNEFWATLLQEPGVPVSQQKGNPNVRIAKLNGVSVLGYLALGLPNEAEATGLVRPGLHVVVNYRFPEHVEAAKKLYELGDILCPAVPAVNVTETAEMPKLPLGGSMAVA